MRVEESFNIIKKNARVLQVSSSNSIEEIRENNQLVGIETDKKIIIGDSISYDNDYSGIVKNINQLDKKKYEIFLFILNKSSIFITPFYFQNKQSINWDKYFCNAYVKYKDKYGVFFLFQYKTKNPLTKEDLLYLEFEKYLCSLDNFVNSYELDGYTMFEYKISDIWENDIKLIISGKYSQISKEAKDLIINFFSPTNNKSISNGTLFKTKERKKEIEELFGVSLSDDDELLGEFLFNDPKIENKTIKERMLMHSEAYGI